MEREIDNIVGVVMNNMIRTAGRGRDPRTRKYGGPLSTIASIGKWASDTISSAIRDTGSATQGLAKFVGKETVEKTLMTASEALKVPFAATSGVLSGMGGRMLAQAVDITGNSLGWAVENPLAAIAAVAAAGLIAGAVSGAPMKKASKRLLPTAAHAYLKERGTFNAPSAEDEKSAALKHGLMAAAAFGPIWMNPGAVISAPAMVGLGMASGLYSTGKAIYHGGKYVARRAHAEYAKGVAAGKRHKQAKKRKAQTVPIEE